MAVAMAALHMAAPSEYQVLHMLMSLLQRQDIFIKKPKSGCSNRQEQFEEELSYLLPKGKEGMRQCPYHVPGRNMYMLVLV